MNFRLDPDSIAPRKLKIEFRKQRRSDFASDLQIMLHVENLRLEGVKKKAAVISATDNFGIERSAVFKALARAKSHFKKMGINFP